MRVIKSGLGELQLRVACGLGIFIAAGCGSPENRESPELGSTELPLVQSQATKPMAIVKDRDGHLIELYDFGSGALVSSAGPAYQSPPEALQNLKPSDDLVAFWRALAPDAVVPREVVDLQARLAHLASTAPSTSAPTGARVGHASANGEKSLSSQPTPFAPVGCNNGCCDSNWLLTICPTVGTYSWFLPNYGYSRESSPHTDLWLGLACSAQGTSSYSISMSTGGGGNWSIPEATYRSFRWIGGYNPFTGPQYETVLATVNWQSNQHLHTFCGAQDG